MCLINLDSYIRNKDFFCMLVHSWKGHSVGSCSFCLSLVYWGYGRG